MLKRNSIFLNVSSSGLVNAAGIDLSSVGLSLARYASELIACPSLASCFCAVRLEIIGSDLQGVLHIFAIWKLSTKPTEHFVFLSVKPQPFIFILP